MAADDPDDRRGAGGGAGAQPRVSIPQQRGRVVLHRRSQPPALPAPPVAPTLPLPRVARERKDVGVTSGVTSDTDLVALMRAGDDEAAEELYRRHAAGVRRYARTCCRDADTADDLTAEVFARTLQAVRGGAGPETAVRAYLLTTVRRVAAHWTKTARREHLVEDFAVFSALAARAVTDERTTESGADVRAMHDAEQTMAVQAFRSLPERWQTVLWHTTIEEESPSEIAPLLGLTPNATAVLAYRAREALKQAYLQAHVSTSLTAGGDCARYADRLGAYARGGLRMRAEVGLRKHLDGCERCRSAAVEVADVNARLRGLLPIAVVGWFAAETAVEAAGFAAVLGAGSAAAGAGAAGAGEELGAGDGGGAEAAGSGTEGTETGAAAGESGAGDGGGAQAGTSGAGGGAEAGDTVDSGSAARGDDAPVKNGFAAGLVAAAVVTALALALTLSGDGGPGTKSRPQSIPLAPAAPLPPPAASGKSDAKEDKGPAGPAGAAKRKPKAKPGGKATAGSASEPGSGSRTGSGSGSGSGSAPGSTSPNASSTRPGSAPPSRPSAPAPKPKPKPPPPAATTSYQVNHLRADVLGDGTKPEVVTSLSGWWWPRGGMSIGGQHYPHGITTRAKSTVTIKLNRPCTAYDAMAGIDDVMHGAGSARFSVYGDNTHLWSSHWVRGGDRAVPVHVPLSGREETLRLVVEPRYAHQSAALTGWALSRLACG